MVRKLAKILVADDEQLIRKLIKDYFTKEGHTVLEAADGLEALTLFKTNPDIKIMLIDIMMPEIDGWEVCKRVRKSSGIPIILVSARSQDFDQILGFESGADDYVTKPFSLAILSKRVDALLKRGASPIEKKTESELITVGELIINTAGHEVYLDSSLVEFTLKEYNILLKLSSHPGRVYTREQLLDELWGIEYEGDTRTVDSHVARIRTKLGKWGSEHIKTIYGTGYKIQI